MEDVERLHRLKADVNVMETSLMEMIQEGKELEYKMHTQTNILDSAAAEYKAAVRHGQIAPNAYTVKERVHLRAAFYLDQITHPPDGDGDGDGDWAFAYRVSQSGPITRLCRQLRIDLTLIEGCSLHFPYQLPIPIAAVAPLLPLPPP